LPVAAMAGKEDERPALATDLLDFLEAADLHYLAHEGAVAMEQVEAFAEGLPQVAEAGARQGPSLAFRRLREGEGEVVESAPAVAAGEAPGERADPPADPLRPRPRQAAQGGGEEPEGAVEQRRLEPGPQSALLAPRHRRR